MSLADFILVFHAAFTGTVIFAVPLIILGGLLRWRWVRNPWFRFTHLGMIVFVSFETLIGISCPLTIWENDLRVAEGGEPYSANGFIASWTSKLLYHPLPHWMFITMYVSYAVLIASLFYFVPVRRKKA